MAHARASNDVNACVKWSKHVHRMAHAVCIGFLTGWQQVIGSQRNLRMLDE